jgi:hypothetical protein
MKWERGKLISGIAALISGIIFTFIGIIFNINCNSISEILNIFYGSKSLDCLYSNIALAAGLILCVIGITLVILSVGRRISQLNRVRPFDVALLSVTGAIIIGAILISTIYEYVPINDVKSVYSNGNLTLYIDRPSTLIVPVRNMLTPVERNLQLIMNYSYHNITITGAKLSTASDSILSYYGDFANTGGNQFGQQIWDMKVNAEHNGEVKNTTNPYTVDVFYINNKGKPEKFTAGFNWPIKTSDFNMVTYFMLVFVGVLLSKYTTKLIDEREFKKLNVVDEYAVINIINGINRPLTRDDIASLKTQIDTVVKNTTKAGRIKTAIDQAVDSSSDHNAVKPEDLVNGIKRDITNTLNVSEISFGKYDYVWILISGVIALLIFSNFQKEVTLTNLLITNISLAFGFGFGFDRILQTGSKLIQI